ncbi:helix-turn-helix domain-containing protein [Streptomyces sp. CMB-StM0423]|uniref:helix-turn-helix domain-containing protein n=1 Tax=Streptomyces sp. CMB-StM0423 TaxID=2059884 RepID=UPI000C70966C|nr:helix-turn-helix transcriptional regulator [Streptomyces sp. CMB-StM0423]AUH41997.1 transcriptional regulator [Streptomyces sp. CMB-StM0423]
MTHHAPNRPARVLPLRPPAPEADDGREPLWRQVVGGVLRRERLAQERTLKDVADAARISMPYLSEVERGLKEASSEVLAAAAQALGLRLADLLVLVHGEIVRLSAIRDRERPAGLSSVTELPSARSRPGDVRLAA